MDTSQSSGYSPFRLLGLIEGRVTELLLLFGVKGFTLVCGPAGSNRSLEEDKLAELSLFEAQDKDNLSLLILVILR